MRGIAELARRVVQWVSTVLLSSIFWGIAFFLFGSLDRVEKETFHRIPYLHRHGKGDDSAENLFVCLL